MLNSLLQAHAVAAQEYLYQAARLLDEVGGDARFWVSALPPLILASSWGLILSLDPYQLIPLGGIPLRPEDVHVLERAIALSQEEMCRLFRALGAASQLLQKERDQLVELWPRSMIPSGPYKGGA